MNRTGGHIVISGSGLACPLGLSRAAAWQAVVDGRCGMGELDAMESALPPGADGGQAPDLPADFAPDSPREVRYLRWALNEALRDARIDQSLPCSPQRVGIVLGTTLHGMRAAGQYLRSGDLSELRSFLATSVIAQAACDLDARGIAITTCSACSSSLGSIALAASLLQSGELDLVIAGGYDPISEYAYAGFNSLRLVAQGPLRPFTRQRQGMKLAEGYGVVVLERSEDAARRGIKPLATILGCGESADAHHLTQPHPEGEGAARAMQAALESAKLSPERIDLVAAHATGTPDNDAGEFAALRRVFGAHLQHTPVVAFKSHLGHTLGGAGVVELLLSATALREQVLPGCVNVAPADVEFDGLRLATGRATPARIRATLNTSLGFGGANTCIVLAPAALGIRQIRENRRREVLISGIGVVLPGAIGADALIAKLRAGQRCTMDTGTIDEAEFVHLLNARRVRRMSDYVKLTLAATALALRDASLDISPLTERASAILGSTHGSSNYSSTYYRQIVEQGIIGANPMLFAEGVPNAGAAHLSLMLSIKGACQTVIGSRTAGLDALRLAALRIADGQWDRAVVSAGEEYCAMVNAAYGHCGLYAGREGEAAFAGDRGFVAGAGAVTLVLESAASLQARGGRSHGSVLACSSARSVARASVEPALQVLRELGERSHVLSSANATRIDGIEAAAICREAPGAIVSSMYGHVPELFSAGPLAGLAAVLLSRQLPAAWGDGNDALRLARGDERPAQFAVLCSDYSGLAAGVRIGIS